MVVFQTDSSPLVSKGKHNNANCDTILELHFVTISLETVRHLVTISIHNTEIHVQHT